MSSEKPQALPSVSPGGVSYASPALEQLRKCPDCHGDTRVVSNYAGVNAFCDRCGKHWPVSQGSPLSNMAVPGRGISKQTYVGADVDIIRR